MIKKLQPDAKLYLLVSVLSAFIIGMGAYGIVQMKAMRQHTQTLYNDRVLPVQQLGNIRFYYENILYVAEQANATRTNFDNAYAEIKQDQDSINAAWRAYLSTYFTDREKSLAGEANQTVIEANSCIEQLKAVIKKEDHAALNRLVNSGFYASIGQASFKIMQLLRLQLQISRRISENSRRDFRLLLIRFIALIVLSLVFVLPFSYYLVKNIRKMMRDLYISNFLTNISHEIRTPLNAIIGFTGLLKQQPLNSKAREYNDNIEMAGESLVAIVNDILDASKIEAGMMRIASHTFSIRALIDSVRNLFLEKARSKNLMLNYRIAPDIPDTLVGDSTRLTQILVNLIGNSLKFTEEGSVTLQVFIRSQKAKNIEIGFSVNDTGIGIDKDKIPFIFDRFNQADDSITRNYGGTGLGLSIVKDLILLQGGNIEVESERDKGTTFNFYIPYKVSKEQLCEHVTSSAQPVEVLDYKFISLLVVDDNPMNQSLMKHLLSRWGVAFDVVSNGIEAIELLKKKKYSVVLMDIQMPGMDGYSTTANIRHTLKSDVPIIAMTAHTMPGEREKCIAAGMNDFISKPVNETKLIKLISKFVPLEQKECDQTQPLNQELAYQYIDLTYMKEIGLGNTNYEKTVTREFIDQVPLNIEELYGAYAQKDLDKIHRTAHEMKTTVSVMGLGNRLNQQLDLIEQAEVINNKLYGYILEVNEVCLAALEEATDYYAKLKGG